EWGRQSREQSHLLGCPPRLFGMPCDTMEFGQHAPAGLQRGVEIDGTFESLDRARSVIRRRKAVPAFLVNTAIPRVLALQDLERSQSRRNLIQATLVDRDEIEHFATFG